MTAHHIYGATVFCVCPDPPSGRLHVHVGKAGVVDRLQTFQDLVEEGLGEKATIGAPMNEMPVICSMNPL